MEFVFRRNMYWFDDKEVRKGEEIELIVSKELTLQEIEKYIDDGYVAVSESQFPEHLRITIPYDCTIGERKFNSSESPFLASSQDAADLVTHFWGEPGISLVALNESDVLPVLPW